MMKKAATVIASEARTIGNLVKLPYTKYVNDTEVVVKRLDMARFDDVYSFYEESGTSGNGYSKHETEKSYLFNRFSNCDVLVMHHAGTDEIMSVMPFNDSPVCRSTNALLCTSQSIASPKWRGQGVMFEMYRVSELYLQDIGYLGFSVRAFITGRNIVPLRKLGGMVVGYIPYCSYFEKTGYVDDVLVAKDLKVKNNYPEYYKEMMIQRNKLPTQIDTTKPVPNEIFPKHEYQPLDIATPSGMMRVRSVRDAEDVWQVENLWKQAAERGEGFGLDEFREDGYFNRKFLREGNMLVVENTLGQIVGASLFGPSSLSRSVKPVLSTCYVTVNPIIRRQRIGRALLEYSMALLKKEGYKGVISDTYVNNFEMLGLLRKLQFQFLGSLPKCAYVAGLGVTDSLLVYTDL